MILSRGSYYCLLLTSSPIGGTLPGRRSKHKALKDSGSSGQDRDKSSGSRKSERTKSGEKIARKPSKELLRIQNFSDSSDEDFRLTVRKEFHSMKRRGSKFSDPSLQTADKKDEKHATDAASSKTDLASSVSPSSSKRSPNISRQSPKKSSRKSRQSPETQRKKTPPPTKSLNMQIKEFIKHSSPPKTRKISESSNSNFDAFNHTSSSKLSHSFSKEQDKSLSPSCSKQSSFSSFPGQSYDDYEYYHPRRSSKEVLDFTSSRKSLDNPSKSESEQQPHPRSQSREDGKTTAGGYKTDESHYKRKEELRQCQCVSPLTRSPSHNREEKEVFDFTSKKLSQLSTATLGRKSRAKENKVDITRKDVEIPSSALVKSPRRKEERNVFDFSVADGNEYATLRKRKSVNRREILDFTSSSDRERDRREVLDFTSTSERRDVLDFTSTSRYDNSSANTSQELLNLKSSSEFLVSASGSQQEEPWPDSQHLSLPRQKSDTKNEETNPEQASAFRKVDFKTDQSFSPIRDTIDPPDLFNPSKQFGEDQLEQQYVRKGGTLKHRYCSPGCAPHCVYLMCFYQQSQATVQKDQEQKSRDGS